MMKTYSIANVSGTGAYRGAFVGFNYADFNLTNSVYYATRNGLYKQRKQHLYPMMSVLQ